MTDENASSAPQGSAQWLYERVGCVTASRFRDVMDRLKNGQPGAKRSAYLWELVVERLTGNPTDHFTSAAMTWGTEQEIASRMHYEAQTGTVVEECGFLRHPKLKMVGGSPDGVIGEDGGWESKSPFNSAVHLQTILAGKMPPDHVHQVQGLMWITGRKWWDFQSFDPRMPQKLKVYRERIARDESYIQDLAVEVQAFEAEVSALADQIGSRIKEPSETAPALPESPEVAVPIKPAEPLPEFTRESKLRSLCTDAHMAYDELIGKMDGEHPDGWTEADYMSACDMLRRRANKIRAGAKA